ncbi:MAG: hypothetical protein EOO03_04590 [Chitinophagaceae bacterium]|nr:MAG: hypothetical protein EOO03_04590 [Chitinophagaceae bacterium]
MHVRPDAVLHAFVFFATLSSYNFYWLLSKYSFNKSRTLPDFFSSNRWYVLMFLTAGAGMLICLSFLPQLVIYVAVGVALTVAYSLPLWPVGWAKHLRKIGVLKTILLAFTWAYITVLLPGAPVVHDKPAAVLSLGIARFFFVGMLCVIFDRRDAAVDASHNIHSIATDLSKATLHKMMLLAFIIYQAAGLLVRYRFADIYQFIAFIFTGLVVGWVYLLSLKPRGYLFYYFVVDGLMIFSAAITFIANLF